MPGSPLTLPESIPEVLLPLARCRTYDRGKYLYRPADQMESVFVMTAGMVKIGAYNPEGEEVIYDTTGPGEFCGNLQYLGGAGRFEEFARAVSPVVVQVFDLVPFKAILRNDAGAHDWFARLLVKRWSRSERRLFRIASLPPAKRLRQLLVELDRDPSVARELLTQSDLACLTGLTRQTVAKLMRTMST